MLIATGGLAYYSLQLQARERYVIRDTMRELVGEKLLGIETAIQEAEERLFDGVRLDRLQSIPDMMIGLPISTVLVLSEEGQIIPGGNHTRLPDRKDFQTLFFSRVLADLKPGKIPYGKIKHLHRSYDGLPTLFAATRRRNLDNEKSFYVVLEFDLPFLVSTVFPQYFNIQSKTLYQVVDQNLELVYGVPFRGVPTDDIVELPFSETLTGWKLRAAQKDASRRASRKSRQATVDLIIIGIALAVIVSGLFGLVGIVRRERRLNDLKSDFISNVSHELKTPLSIISMFGELLSSGRVKSPEKTKEYANIVQRESGRLTRLIDNVLDFAKIERGADVYEFTEGCLLSDVVEKAIDVSQPRFSNSEMEVDFVIEESEPTIRVDDNAMTLAILNIFDNATKYAAEGKRLKVRIAKEKSGVALAIRDFGPGIEDENQQLIFERFFRSESARLRPVRGSGIGLSLVRHIVEAHGGTVNAKRASPGSVFTIWIPASES